MAGPYANPGPGNALRCPECGSTNAWCEEDDAHTQHWHLCDDCGYTGIFRGKGPDPEAK